MTTPNTSMWDASLFDTIPQTTPCDLYDEPGVQGIFYDTLPHRGKPTKSFAWMGMPALAEGETCPGIVLVHGGGGTAFANWVRLWNSRGYAAIAMDTCGALPYGQNEDGSLARHDHDGPAGWGDFEHALDAPEDQWVYHAVADVILAHNLLRAQPGVDADRIGLTGISWGGFLTCILAGVDPRYQFAMPVYGCGNLGVESHWKSDSFPKLSEETAAHWLELWDPSHYLPSVTCPMCWVTGTNDFAFHMKPLQLSYRQPQTAHTLCIRIEMPHGHGPAGEHPRELHVFADSIVNKGQALATITGSGTENGKLWATYASPRPIMRAAITYTRASGYGPDQKYNALPATIDRANQRIDATIPVDTTRCFLNLFDDRECVVSTEHIDRV